MSNIMYEIHANHDDFYNSDDAWKAETELQEWIGCLNQKNFDTLASALVKGASGESLTPDETVAVRESQDAINMILNNIFKDYHTQPQSGHALYMIVERRVSHDEI